MLFIAAEKQVDVAVHRDEANCRTVSGIASQM